MKIMFISDIHGIKTNLEKIKSIAYKIQLLFNNLPAYNVVKLNANDISMQNECKSIIRTSEK